MSWLLSLLTIFFAIVSLMIIIGNPLAAYLARREGKNYSWGPFIGGISGCLACLISPWEAARAWWWIPLIVDLTIPMFAFLPFYLLYRRLSQSLHKKD